MSFIILDFYSVDWSYLWSTSIYRGNAKSGSGGSSPDGTSGFRIRKINIKSYKDKDDNIYKLRSLSQQTYNNTYNYD